MNNIKIASHLEEISKRILEAEPKNEGSAKGYKRAADVIRKHGVEIRSAEQAAELRGIGPKITKTIGEFLLYGKSERNELLKPLTPNIQEIVFNPENEKQLRFKEYLKNLYDFGAVKAQSLIDEGYTNLYDIYMYAPLNNQQRKGIYWRNHINQPVPRSEIDVLRIILSELWANIPEIHWEIVGSYRRGEEKSGDVDILVYSPHVNITGLVNALQTFIVERLTETATMFEGLFRLSNKLYAHRIDIKLSSIQAWPFMMLYFTGSQQFNILMRSRAISLGLKLNEVGLTIVQTGEYIPLHSEEEVFRYLGLKYLTPEQRMRNLKFLERS